MTDRSVLHRAVFLAGPTSAGKSQVALALAREHGGEIVCADAFQLYADFPVLSAAPGADERAVVPHHLFGMVPCHEEMDAARFAGLALDAIAAVAARGRLPVVVGGSGLYLQALIAGLPELPSIDPAVREEVRGMTLGDMITRLRDLDPASLAVIDVHNPRRVARRLELCLQTGTAASELLTEAPAPEGLRGIVLTRDRDELNVRIGAAVAARLAGGAIEEVRAARGMAGRTARQILGWKEITSHLDGASTMAECLERLVVATRRYAKRQLTWFRGKSTFPLENLSAVTRDNPDHIARLLGLA